MGQGDIHLMTVEPCFEFFDDFFYFNSEKWLFHQVGGGCTAELVNADLEIRGGVLALAVPANDNRKVGIKLGGDSDNGAAWQITKDSGKQLWFATKVRVLQAVDLAMYVGLFNPEKLTFGEHMGKDNTGEPEFADAPDGWTDGIYMRILTATPTEIDFAVARNKVETEVRANIVANDMAWHELGFYFDGLNSVIPVIDRTAYPTYKVLADAAGFPHDLGLLPRFYIQTGEDAIKVLKADWIRVKQER